MNLQELLGSIARFSAKRYRLVLGVALALFIVFFWRASQLDFDPDLLALLPAEVPAVATYRILAEEFGNLDQVVVAIRIPERAPVEPYLDWADHFADRLAEVPEVEDVERGPGEPVEWVTHLLPRLMVYLGEEERGLLLERLSEEGLDRRARELRERLLTPEAPVWTELWRHDPAGLAEWILGRVVRGERRFALDWTSGRFLSADHRLLLLLVQPAGRPQDLEFNRRLVEGLEEAWRQVRPLWPRLTEGIALPEPVVELGGRHVVALEEADLIRKDLWKSTLLSVSGVLLLLWTAFRRKLLLVLVFLPLSFGLVATLAIASWSLSRLSATTAAVVALLVGLANDFIIVLYGRYLHERLSGASWTRALETMSGQTGRGVTIGALTTAGAFMAFMVTDFSGLREMGLLVGMGIVVCLLAILFLLPALLAWRETRRDRAGRSGPLVAFAFGGGALTRRAFNSPRTTLLVVVLASLLALPAALRLRFEPSALALRPEGGRSARLEEAVREHFGGDLDRTALLVRAASLESLLERLDETVQRAERAVQSGELAGVESVTRMLPPLARQRKSIDWLARERAAGNLDPERIEVRLRRALERHGLRPEGFRPGFELLRQMLTAEHPFDPDELLASPEGRTLLRRYVRGKAETWWGLVQLSHPAGWPKQLVLPAAERLAAELGPDVRVAGVALLSREIRNRVTSDAWFSALLGGGLVLGLLWLDLRSVRLVALALVPLSLGLLWMIALIPLTGQTLNLMNVFVVTMVLGIGVDYGLHLVHRSREMRDADESEFLAGIVASGKGIFLAALTTSVGFGALSVSHYPGLVSIGYAAILGALGCVFAALTAVPAILALSRAEGEAKRGESARREEKQ